VAEIYARELADCCATDKWWTGFSPTWHLNIATGIRKAHARKGIPGPGVPRLRSG